jgi:5-methylcytosine-specific restriction endonuclease McrA
MRKRGVTTEPYTMAEIALRDRFICGLCHKRVAMTRAVPHPRSPTIDHVIPLADDGHDVRANVQLAHFECNWRKGSRGTQQLALIG